MLQILLFFIFLLTPLYGGALEGETTTPEHPLSAESQNPAQTYNYWHEFVNMLYTLAFVIALIFLSIWVLKKMMRSRVKSLNQANGIRILERRPLSAKATIYLVDILGKGIVISESPAGVHRISEFPESFDIGNALESRQEEKKPRISFRELMAKKINKQKMQKNA